MVRRRTMVTKKPTSMLRFRRGSVLDSFVSRRRRFLWRASRKMTKNDKNPQRTSSSFLSMRIDDARCLPPIVTAARPTLQASSLYCCPKVRTCLSEPRAGAQACSAVTNTAFFEIELGRPWPPPAAAGSSHAPLQQQIQSAPIGTFPGAYWKLFETSC
jgi:hypothetical protein